MSLTDKTTEAGWAHPRRGAGTWRSWDSSSGLKWSPRQDSSSAVLDSAPPAASIVLTFRHELDRKVRVIHPQYMSQSWRASRHTVDGYKAIVEIQFSHVSRAWLWTCPRHLRFCASVFSCVDGGGFQAECSTEHLVTFWLHGQVCFLLWDIPLILWILSVPALSYWDVSPFLCNLKLQIFLLPVCSHLKKKKKNLSQSTIPPVSSYGGSLASTPAPARYFREYQGTGLHFHQHLSLWISGFTLLASCSKYAHSILSCPRPFWL